ncbi:NusG domain II-containing protein [Aedoeadaptatus coxii]|uniref:NusG domain II-containing protein n=1 Tax=Aedoeadaptatus coxii TaxID=755172 RepID=UPI002AD54BDF|nr:NusG domain II-containing protein [Peptoniphilus coxii]
MNRTDVLIGLVVILIAAGVGAWQFIPKKESSKTYISVQIDGKETKRIPMTPENYGKDFVFHSHGGTNILRISEKGCIMKEADCPDGICMRMAPIKTPGEMIVCLPHRIIAEVKSDDTPKMDILLK